MQTEQPAKTVTISASCGGKAEKVLEAIAKRKGSDKYWCDFGWWHIGASSGLKECHGTVGAVGKDRVFVSLVVGRMGDIPIVDMLNSSRWQPCETHRGYSVNVGKSVPDERIRNIADQVIAWVACGDESNRRPFGEAPQPKKFTVSVDPPLRGYHRRRHRDESFSFVRP